MKEHPKYKGIFVCPDGRIFSNKRGNLRQLKPQKTGSNKKYNNGYLSIYVQSRPNRKSVKIHRLVAETYIPNPNNLPVVHHIDENKLNNDVSNLEWVTQQQNCEHTRCKNKYSLIDTKTNLVYEITNISKFAKENNLDISSLTKVIRGERNICKGFVLNV